MSCLWLCAFGSCCWLLVLACFWFVLALVCGVRGCLVVRGAFRGSGVLFSVFSCLVRFGLVCGVPFLACFRAFGGVFRAFLSVCLSLALLCP